jgi:SAM-dependent methyltransferase
MANHDLKAVSLETQRPHIGQAPVSLSHVSGTGNALQRRLRDPNFITKYFVGHGIDIGAKHHNSLRNYHEFFPLMHTCRNWDIEDGDAQYMTTVGDNSFNFVHSSHCLEHLRDPFEALINWWRILQPGGHLVVIVPDEDMYEQGVWPSQFNGDHKNSFTIYKHASWCDHSINLLHQLQWLAIDYGNLDIIKVERLTQTFRHEVGKQDQTGQGAECGIEFIVRKTHDETSG